MAEIFVSYTSKDRDWAFWIGQELTKLGHMPRIDAWEIPGGGNIMAWMQERLEKADHALCVISEDYFKGPFASAEQQAALWAAQKRRTNFLLPVRIANFDLPIFLAPLKYCDLFGVSEDEARARLTEFFKPAGRPASTEHFPGTAVVFPGHIAISNIPVKVPRHFIGRDRELAAIEEALNGKNVRSPTIALHGLRGVGKTVLAAAYAELHRVDYRATWWIRADAKSTVYADLVSLGVRLDWVLEGEPEDESVVAVLERLRVDGAGILLIYDNVPGPTELSKFLPPGIGPHIIVTSNAPDFGGMAALAEIGIWPTQAGADFLIARTDRPKERDAALALSEALEGLPLAHEQAATYCQRIGISLTEYLKRLATAPVELLDDTNNIAGDYGLTVAKTFSLAIEKAAKRHRSAALLISFAALLPPEPIPMFLFREASEELHLDTRNFALKLLHGLIGMSSFRGRGPGNPADRLADGAIAALRAFGLIDCELIVDERDPSILTDCIRLHRLVREVAAATCTPETKTRMRRELISGMARVYPVRVHREHKTWPRARRLDALALSLVAGSEALPQGSEVVAANLLDELEAYRDGALASYDAARKLAERALSIREKALGSNHLDTAKSVTSIAFLLQAQRKYEEAQPLFLRALNIREDALGHDHPETATSLSNLATLHFYKDDFVEAQRCCEQALSIREKVLGPDHADTATTLDNLSSILQKQGDFLHARPHSQRALNIYERTLGPDHLETATSLNNLGRLLRKQGCLTEARPYAERALAIFERAQGVEHPDTLQVARNVAELLTELGANDDARALRRRFNLKNGD